MFRCVYRLAAALVGRPLAQDMQDAVNTAADDASFEEYDENKCFKCGGPNHWSQECELYHARSQIQQLQMQLITQAPPPPSAPRQAMLPYCPPCASPAPPTAPPADLPKCWRCNQVGHQKADCTTPIFAVIAGNVVQLPAPGDAVGEGDNSGSMAV